MNSDRELPESGMHAGASDCSAWEADMADLADGVLPPAREAALREHVAECPLCGQLFEETVQGREWVRYLHDAPPQAPEALLDRILAQTSEAMPPPRVFDQPAPAQAMGQVIAMPAAAVSALRRQQQARALMTAAMAVFSTAITLSMMGSRVADLHPATVAATASHQFFDTKKQVVAFYDNLRLVREVETTVQDMRRSMDNDKSNQHKSGGPSAQGAPAEVMQNPLMASRESTGSQFVRAAERNTL